MADTFTTRGYKINLLNLFYGSESAFGTKVTADTFLPTAAPVTLDLKRARHPDESSKQGLGIKGETEVIGHKSESTMSLTKELQSWSLTPEGVAPGLSDIHPDSGLIYTAMGGISAAGATTTTEAGSTVDNIVVASAASLEAGVEVLIGDVISQIVSVTTGGSEEIVISPPLETAPASGVSVTTGICCYAVGQDRQATCQSLSMEALGQSASDARQMMGCRPNSLKIKGENKGYLMAEVGFNVADWDYLDSGGAPARQTYPYPKDQIVNCQMVAYDGTTRYRLPIKSFEFDLGLAIEAIGDPNKKQGVAEWGITELNPTLTLSMLKYATETSVTGFNALFAAKTSLTMVLQVGTALGRTIAIVIPAGKIRVDPSYSDMDGWIGQDLEIECQLHTKQGTANSTTYDDDSPADKSVLVIFN